LRAALEEGELGSTAEACLITDLSEGGRTLTTGVTPFVAGLPAEQAAAGDERVCSMKEASSVLQGDGFFRRVDKIPRLGIFFF